jgi:serine/threonine protein kinase
LPLLPEDPTLLTSGADRDKTTPVDGLGLARSGAQIPTAIGRYRILRLLGEGGMGAVYEAEQDQPRRLVALKVIRAAWASPELIRRFEQESQALARLHHPGIAQIYEAGAAETPFGVQPYFAMELIHGKPLVEYAEEHKLSTPQRLELMIAVCEAVEHAHQRGIIHRDLKPANILVDETGQPKILDFGLATIYNSDGKYPQAEALASQVMEFRRKVLGLESKQTLAAMEDLFIAYKGEKKYAQAEALGQQTLQMQRRVMGSEDPDTLSTATNLAYVYLREGKIRSSESLLIKTVETERRVLGPASAPTAMSLGLLAYEYAAQGRYSEAEDLFRQYSQGSSANPEVDKAFAWFLLTAPDPVRRDPAQGLALARRALQSEPDNPDGLTALGLAEVRNRLWDEAIATLEKAAALHGGTGPDDFLFLAQAYQGRGDAAHAGGNYERAVKLMGDVAVADPDDVPLWRETAAALGKTAPPSPKGTAMQARGTR